MLSENDKIESGILKLQSYSLPPLTAGTYTLKSSLAVEDGSEQAPGIPQGQSYDGSLKFEVSAPQFAIDPALIYSVYPSPGSTGAYHTTLPHIILTRKTLPWERNIGGVPDNRPWLCLLLLSEDEIVAGNVTTRQIDPAMVTEAAPGDPVIVPAITAPSKGKTDNQEKIQVLELPLALFTSITPQGDELHYLAHTRQVNTANKEQNDAYGKGWYSSVMCNRLPQPGMPNTVYLVSLEGHGDTINSSGADNNAIVRLVLLHQWSFTEQGATLEALVDQLAHNVAPFRIELPEADPQQQATDAPIRRALQYGYMPISHDLRAGAKTVSWYRGPLVPVDVPTPEQYQYNSADEALRFDEGTGMFDISYASAWQLGRLLALQTAGFSTALSNWKTAYRRDLPVNIAESILLNPANDSTKPAADFDMTPDSLTETAHSVASDELLRDLMLEFWNTLAHE